MARHIQSNKRNVGYIQLGRNEPNSSGQDGIDFDEIEEETPPPVFPETPTPIPPSSTPPPTPTRTPTPTTSTTPTSSTTPSASVSQTPSTTPTPSNTATPSRTPAASGTIPTTPTASPSGSPTSTPSNSASATPGLTPSVTPSNTATPSSTPTSTPSTTPTPSVTSTPTQSLSAIPPTPTPPTPTPFTTPTPQNNVCDIRCDVTTSPGQSETEGGSGTITFTMVSTAPSDSSYTLEVWNVNTDGTRFMVGNRVIDISYASLRAGYVYPHPRVRHTIYEYVIYNQIGSCGRGSGFVNRIPANSSIIDTRCSSFTGSITRAIVNTTTDNYRIKIDTGGTQGDMYALFNELVNTDGSHAGWRRISGLYTLDQMMGTNGVIVSYVNGDAPQLIRVAIGTTRATCGDTMGVITDFPRRDEAYRIVLNNRQHDVTQECYDVNTYAFVWIEKRYADLENWCVGTEDAIFYADQGLVNRFQGNEYWYTIGCRYLIKSQLRISQQGEIMGWHHC